jgi:NAD(P)H-dependent FMN reductase
MLSASDPSVGRLCVPALQLALREAGATSAAWDIRSLPPVWVDKRELHEFPPAYSELAEAIEASDGVVLVVPIHCYAVSGSAKTVTEIVAEALTRKPVAIVTAAGSTRSHLAPRDLMTSLMLNQETICYPGTVQATEDLMQGTRPNKELRGRLADLAAHFVSFVSALQPFIDEFGAEA